MNGISGIAALRGTALAGWPRLVLRLSAVALLMTLIAPYGTYGLPLGWRALFWLAGVFAVALPIVAIQRMLVARHRPAWPEGAQWTAAAALAAPIAALLVALLLAAVAGADPELGLARLALLALQVFLLSLVVVVLLLALRRLFDHGPAAGEEAGAPIPVETTPMPSGATADAGAAAAEAAFLRGAAPRLGGSRLLALQAEDHYLRIHTDGGSELILMPLGRAVDALHAVPGRRVHRSFWVADAARVGIRRSGSTTLLLLSGGLEVPVSKRLLPELRREGWLPKSPEGQDRPPTT